MFFRKFYLNRPDGEVSGADHVTGDVLRPAFHYVKTAPGISIVSGEFIMILPDKNFGENGVIIFADGAVHPNPNEKELAEITIATAHTAKAIGGFEPRIAKEMAPDLYINGELQMDAALTEAISRSKAPCSLIAGNANVLIFRYERN